MEPWSHLTGALIRGRGRRDAQAQRRAPMRTQWEGGHLRAQEKGLPRNQPCQHLGLGLAASRTVRNQRLLFKPLGP